MKLRLSFLSIILICILTCAQDKNPINTDNSYKLIVSDLNIPWGFTFLPDGSMLINEKAGELIHFKNGKKTTISGLPEVYVNGQGGLMDIILHPNYKENGWIYFSYASSEGENQGGNTAIARAKLNGNRIDNLNVLYKAIPNSRRGQHFGSRLVFDKDGYLFFTIGERGNRDVNPQDITRDCGKVYRLNDDGSIPNDNPFVNEPNAKKPFILTATEIHKA